MCRSQGTFSRSRYRTATHDLHDLGCRISELFRAERVSRIDPERGTDHSPARSKRASRPPDVKRRDVSVPDALLAAGVCADLLDGEIHLD